MTPSTLVTDVRSEFNEATASFISDANDIYPAIQDAEYELASEIGCIQATSVATSTVAGTQEYTAPTTLIRIEALRWNGVKLKRIDLTELETLSNSGYGGSTSQGNPVYYYEWGTSIGLYPIPNSVAVLKYYFIQRPTLLSAASSAFNVPEEFQFAIRYFVLWRLFLKDQDERCTFYAQAWEDAKRRLKHVWAMRKTRDQHVTVRDVESLNSTDLGLI